MVYEDNDYEDIILHDVIHLVQDSHVPEERVILCLKYALQEMLFPVKNHSTRVIIPCAESSASNETCSEITNTDQDNISASNSSSDEQEQIIDNSDDEHDVNMDNNQSVLSVNETSVSGDCVESSVSGGYTKSSRPNESETLGSGGSAKKARPNADTTSDGKPIEYIYVGYE